MVVGFVTAGSLSEQTIRFVTPTHLFKHVLGQVPDCDDVRAPGAVSRTGRYHLVYTYPVQLIERRIQKHELGEFKGKNKEIDRRVNPSPGWAIDVTAPREQFLLRVVTADNGRCEGIRWNTLSATGVITYARVDRTKHTVPRDGKVNCNIELPEMRTLTIEKTEERSEPIDWQQDMPLDIPSGSRWRLTIITPRQQKEIFVSARDGRHVSIATDASSIIISPK